jgi:putative addiction module component (TIGR02574 family)
VIHGLQEYRYMPPNAVSVFDLTPAEKLQLVEDLWDDLAANPADVPMPSWQIDELDRRKARLQPQPATGLDWESVKAAVRRHHAE